MLPVKWDSTNSETLTPEPLDPVIHSNMFTYAHLIDISYCIDRFRKIEEPFNCDLDCSKRFPDMKLVHQWYFDDAVCGYIASTYSNIFEYEEDTSMRKKKTIVVGLRGTRSVSDVLADMRVDMALYQSLKRALPFCGQKCKIHKGFASYYKKTLAAIEDKLVDELELGKDEDYELVFVGHSLGGSVALLLALHFLDLGYDKLTLVTMGQPRVGNNEFTSWADFVLGSYHPLKHGSFDRKYMRVIHKGDLVTQVPSTSAHFIDRYDQFLNQVYLNITGSNTKPKAGELVDCFSERNSLCVANDFSMHNLGRVFFRNYYEAHNTYFRQLGLCGLGTRDEVSIGIF